MGKKLTLREWRRKTLLSAAEVARRAELTPRILLNAEKYDPTQGAKQSKPTEITLLKLVNMYREFFEGNQRLLGDDVLPKDPSDFAGISIYDPNIDRAPRTSSKKQHESLNLNF